VQEKERRFPKEIDGAQFFRSDDLCGLEELNGSIRLNCSQMLIAKLFFADKSELNEASGFHVVYDAR
jgi:hypothetical protein